MHALSSMMKTLPILARAVLVFLGVLCAVGSGYPGYSPGALEVSFKFGYPAFTDVSPVPRGLLSIDRVTTGRLSKRACPNVGDLYCEAFNICCLPGYSCCSNNFCCAAGYACPVSGPCYKTDVVTVTYTTTNVFTSGVVSTVYATSTSLVILTSTGYTTVTTHVQSGVSTSTVWTTVTTTQIMKRDALTAPTPAVTEKHDARVAAPEPSMEAFLVEGSTPITDLLSRAFANVGLLEKRAVTSYRTLTLLSTYYSYSFYTVRNVVTSTSTMAVQSTITSTIVDGASTTTTVTSTTTATVVSTSSQVVTPSPSPEPPNPGPPTSTSSQPPNPPSPTPLPPPSQSSSVGLSTGQMVGVIVGPVCGMVGAIGAAWVARKRWKGKASNPPPSRF